jgi:virginiamycin A acetyltransferase
VTPYSVVAGNPARLVRERFDSELVGLLERLRWWDLPVAEIQALIPLLGDPDHDAVKAAIRSRLG